jgi:hypothetical protein
MRKSQAPCGASSACVKIRASGFDAPALRMADLDAEAIAQAVAEVGWRKALTPQPRPAPFYLRGADAAPPSDPPPVILP